jgi:hypothetical protein
MEGRKAGHINRKFSLTQMGTVSTNQRNRVRNKNDKKTWEWLLADGMSEHGEMVLAGHANVATTCKFYLAVQGSQLPRGNVKDCYGLARLFFGGEKMVDSVFKKLLYFRDLEISGV